MLACCAVRARYSSFNLCSLARLFCLFVCLLFLLTILFWFSTETLALYKSPTYLLRLLTLPFDGSDKVNAYSMYWHTGAQLLSLGRCWRHCCWAWWRLTSRWRHVWRRRRRWRSWWWPRRRASTDARTWTLWRTKRDLITKTWTWPGTTATSWRRGTPMFLRATAYML